MRLFETLKASNPSLKIWGFYTSEVRERSERVGFQVVILQPHSPPPFPAFQSLRWPTVGKYKVDAESFESLALPELRMELFCSSFFSVVLKILESIVLFLASVPFLKFGLDIPAVFGTSAVARLMNHRGATMFTLSQSNRDFVKEEIYSQLVALLSKQQMLDDHCVIFNCKT
ncbi:cancer-related nucleoside-triphosphatase-like protein [Pyrus ussuriensis x Pyrus communis]|uniref:Cancer-related nucleoside-triphosphatase-like protein n=1 Tax=Pyrus ussuriensis x Pyrus communis TaxID=2448454 RepID=A0A5N5I1R8_9ROSA|nr:cancer-related nucleoside-triphosphatase-like protein [Pyrus ussuriensis x Pyrus communis]